MSKHKTSTPRNRYLLPSALVVVVLIAVLTFVMLRPTTIAGKKLSPTEYQSQFATSNTPYLLVDVRTADEFATGHIHGAVNIPLDTLETRLNEIPQTQPVVLYCRSGNRSGKAAQLLSNAGYTNIYDLGGTNAWTEQGLPLE